MAKVLQKLFYLNAYARFSQMSYNKETWLNLEISG